MGTDIEDAVYSSQLVADADTKDSRSRSRPSHHSGLCGKRGEYEYRIGSRAASNTNQYGSMEVGDQLVVQ